MTGLDLLAQARDLLGFDGEAFLDVVNGLLTLQQNTLRCLHFSGALAAATLGGGRRLLVGVPTSAPAPAIAPTSAPLATTLALAPAFAALASFTTAWLARPCVKQGLQTTQLKLDRTSVVQKHGYFRERDAEQDQKKKSTSSKSFSLKVYKLYKLDIL